MPTALGAIAAAGTLLATLALAGETPAGAATALPKASMSAGVLTVVEGNSGTTTVVVPVTLNAAATTAVTVSYATADGTAKAGDDYVAKSGTITFPVGNRSQSITVAVTGDTVLEDYQQFSVKLTAITGSATLGTKSKTIQILNDDKPKVTVPAVKVSEGATAAFAPKLVQRYYQPLTVNAKTVDGTAKAPGDYTAVTQTATFAAGTKGPVSFTVPTVADSVVEPNETFTLQVSSASIAATVNGKGTIAEVPVCPSGSNPTTAMPAAPPSPSAAATSGPPTAVTGGTPWDLMWSDDFDSQSATNAKWSNGMRDGSLTLEGNLELTWYSPANSTVTTDNDGFGTISVLQQKITQQPISGQYYTARTLNRIYPPSRCPSLYYAGKTSGTNVTKVPYQFRAGMLNNAKSFGFKYGYVEARAKMPKGFSFWPALWLRDWGNWIYEVDVMEGFDRQARVFRSTYWWGGGQSYSTENDVGGDVGLLSSGGACHAMVPVPTASGNAGECALNKTLDLSAGYHTYGLLWTPTKYEFYLDGVKHWQSRAGANITSAYNFLILSMGMGNSEYEFDWTKEPVKPLDANLFSLPMFSKPSMEWDYVRVWQAPNAHNVCTTGSC